MAKEDGVVKRVRNRKGKNAKMASVPTKLSKAPKATRLNQLDYDPNIFKTMKTGNVVDTFFSNKGGIPKACNFIVVGDPGVGKTTVCLDMLADVSLSGTGKAKPKVLFISAEMNEIDLYEYLERYPKFGDLDILFLADYTEENPKLVIEEMLKSGYDLVLGDSFVEIQETIKEECYMTTSQSEKWLIDLMCQHNKGNNAANAYTTFLMIQQMTKGGVFVGSNKLKHNTTGMLEIRFSTDGNINSPRFIEFSKNRRGNVLKRLYFDMSAKDNVHYNAKKWEMDIVNEQRLKDELDELVKEESAFDQLIAEARAASEETDKDADDIAQEVIDAATADIEKNEARIID